MLYVLVNVLPALASFLPAGYTPGSTRSGYCGRSGFRPACNVSVLRTSAVLASQIGIKLFFLAWGLNWIQIPVEYQQV